MYGNLEDLISEISKKSSLGETEIKKRIDEKITEFSGLISPEGAAHIVANEMGFSLLKNNNKELKIENIAPNMNGVNIKGKIIRILEPREFEKNGKKGRVVNIIIGDETGNLRISLWDEQVSLIDNFVNGESIKVVNGYTTKDNIGQVEIRVGKRGKIRKIEDEIELKRNEQNSLKAIAPGMNVITRACLVQVFGNKFFFKVCPICGKTVKDRCEEHDVEPEKELVINGVIDDGFDNIRTVFFRENAEKILGMKKDEILEITENGENMDPVKNRLDEILGKEFLIGGFSKMNSFFERLELVANKVENIDPEKESEKIINKFKSKL